MNGVTILSDGSLASALLDTESPCNRALSDTIPLQCPTGLAQLRGSIGGIAKESGNLDLGNSLRAISMGPSHSQRQHSLIRRFLDGTSLTSMAIPREDE